VHVVAVGSEEESRTLAFRDYLREHNDVAEAYGRLKISLAPNFSASDAGSREDYATAKGAFIERITQQAIAAGYPLVRGSPTPSATQRMSLATPTIGAVAEHEIEAVASLMRGTIQPLAYYNEQARRVELAKYTADTLRSLIADDPQAVLVARDGAELIGFCVSRFDDGTVWLDWFGTDVRARSRGVGASLLVALTKTLPSRNAHKIWCDSRTDNATSKSVLERAGYRRIATLTNHWYGQDYFLWEWYP
jgi:ribosomal protein S18 acetylase RimI-like enzyme